MTGSQPCPSGCDSGGSRLLTSPKLRLSLKDNGDGWHAREGKREPGPLYQERGFQQNRCPFSWEDFVKLRTYAGKPWNPSDKIPPRVGWWSGQTLEQGSRAYPQKPWMSTAPPPGTENRGANFFLKVGMLRTAWWHVGEGQDSWVMGVGWWSQQIWDTKDIKGYDL